MTARIIRTGSLLRVSTTSVEQAESPDNQLSYIREEVRRHSTGDEVWVDSELTYKDELTGALVLERKGIKQLLADVQAGLIDMIIMKGMRALGRETLGMLMLKRRLWDDLNVDLVMLQEGYRASRDMELIFLIHADRAQHGRLEISRNVRIAHRQRALKNLWPSGSIPFGYHRVGRNQLAPHPQTSAVAATMFRLRAEGWGVSAIVEHLNNELRVPAPYWWRRWEFRRERLAKLAAEDERWAARFEALRARYEGKRPLWRANTVTRILHNTAYIGELAYYRSYWRRAAGGKLVRVPRPEHEHLTLSIPPILDRDLWERCQDVKRRRVGRGKPQQDRFLLSRLVYCGLCDSLMTGSFIARAETGYYICNRRRNEHSCIAPSVRAEALERQVIDAVREGLQRLSAVPMTSPQHEKAPSHRSRIRAIEAGLTDLKDQRRYYRNEHRLGRVTLEELNEEMDRITRQEEDLGRQLAQLRGGRHEVVQEGARLRQLIAMAQEDVALAQNDRAAIRQMLLLAVDRITVTPNTENPAQVPERALPHHQAMPDRTDLPPLEILHEMMRDPQGRDVTIAKLLGCDDGAILRRRRAAGIPPKPKGGDSTALRNAFLHRWQPVLQAWREGLSPEDALARLEVSAAASREFSIVVKTHFNFN